MKRNISDLLDCYLEEDLEPNGVQPLSSRRIKEMTMKKIEKKETGGHRGPPQAPQQRQRSSAQRQVDLDFS